MGPIGWVAPMGAMVVLVCVLDVLGGVIVVVMVVGRWVLLHVAVLGVMPVWRALCRPLMMAGHQMRRVGQAWWVWEWLRRGWWWVSLRRGLPSLTPK